MSERYQVSRTSVREAALRLVHEGYLIKYPKKGYGIRCTGERELENLKACRYIIESGVIDIVVRQASDEEIKSVMSYVEERSAYQDRIVYWSHQFHLNLAKLTKNEELCAMLEGVLYKIARSAARSQQNFLDRYRLLARNETYVEPEHYGIVDALLKRDAEQAKAILKKDIYDILEE